MTIKSVYKSEIPAKINLSLEITGRADNLHTLKMLVCPYRGYSDIVEFYPNTDKTDIEIEIAEAYIGFDKARFLNFFNPKIKAIGQKLGIGGRLVVNKGVPLGAGLGGSSASIAGALSAMCDCARELGNYTPLDTSFLLALGSDVPCMLYSKPCIVTGVGEIVSPVNLPFDTECFKVEIAEGGSDTAACYALYDRLKEEGADTSVCTDVAGDSDSYEHLSICGEDIALFKNDLTLPACSLNKNIQTLIIALKEKHNCVFLSGSGSAVVFKADKF